MRKILINYYLNIQDKIDAINSWKDPDTFDLRELDSNQIEKLNQINVIEFEYMRNSINKEDLYDIFDNYKQLYNSLLNIINIKTYFIITEHNKSIPNKVRNYKGLFYKDLKASTNSLQFESHFNDGNSLLIAIVELSENNRLHFIENYLFDSDCSFIYFTLNNKIKTEAYLRDFTLDKMYHKNVSKIDYPKVLINLQNDDFILRVSGNEGDTHLGLQLFFHKSKIYNIQQIVKQLKEQGFNFSKVL